MCQIKNNLIEFYYQTKELWYDFDSSKNLISTNYGAKKKGEFWAAGHNIAGYLGYRP